MALSVSVCCGIPYGFPVSEPTADDDRLICCSRRLCFFNGFINDILDTASDV
jgi:hypothetical protein